MKALPPIVTTLAVLLLLLGGYVGAYLGRSERIDQEDAIGRLHGIDRHYRHAWERPGFVPAAWVESKLRGVKVRAVHYPPPTVCQPPY